MRKTVHNDSWWHSIRDSLSLSLLVFVFLDENRKFWWLKATYKKWSLSNCFIYDAYDTLPIRQYPNGGRRVWQRCSTTSFSLLWKILSIFNGIHIWCHSLGDTMCVHCLNDSTLSDLIKLDLSLSLSLSLSLFAVYIFGLIYMISYKLYHQ